MVRPGNAVVAGILEYSYLLMSVYIYIYMVVIHPVSLDCTIYVLLLGVFAIESSCLIGHAYVYYLLLDINTSFPRTKTEKGNSCHGN